MDDRILRVGCNIQYRLEDGDGGSFLITRRMEKSYWGIRGLFFSSFFEGKGG